MTADLHPCSSCARHILSSEADCPFCGQIQMPAAAPRRVQPKGRMSRAALVAFGTLAVTPAVACGGSDDDQNQGDGDGDMSGDGDMGDGDMAGDGDTAAPVYGIAPTGGMSGDGDMTGDGDTSAPVYGSAPTGGASNEGGMGGETATGGAGTGGADNMGTGGLQVAPVYGVSPIPPEKG